MSDTHKSDGAEPSAEATPALHTLYFYLTEGCNLACRHCWLSPKYDKDGSAHATLPVPVFEQAVAEAKSLGLNTVKFTGGEPLLHPRFAELLGGATRESLKVIIETNGLLCDEEAARLIATAPNPFVSVSIDGADAETHEWVRGVKGSFQAACDAVTHLARADLSPQIIMTLMRRNVDQVEPLVRMAERIGAKSVKFNLVQPTARGEKLHDEGSALGIDEMIELGKYVDEELSASTEMDLHYDAPPAFRALSRISGSGGKCGIIGILGVLSTGHYALCGIGMHVRSLVFGRVGEDNLEAVWRDHPVLRGVREGMPGELTGVCGRCLMKHRCLGSCLAQNYYSSGNLWGAYWFCEEAERRGLFPASRLEDG